MDPKQIEELLHIMNQTEIGLVVPEKNSETELPVIPANE